MTWCHFVFPLLSILVFGCYTKAQTSSPLFVKILYQGTCVEGTSTDSVILAVKALDPDAGPSGQLDYSIQENDWFKIDNTGAIRVKAVIDAENPDVSDVMTYIVTATDRGTPKRSGETTVHIRIGDQNENRPRFGRFLYFADVYQNDPVGTVVVNSRARDADRDARLVYDMIIPSPYFHIDKDTGSVTVVKTIDYNEVTNYYSGRPVFYVRARVNDGRYLSIVTVLTRVHPVQRQVAQTTTQPIPTTPAPGCTVGGQRYLDGVQNPENNCEVCRADVSLTYWTAILVPLRAGDAVPCENVCSHLQTNVPTYLRFFCTFPFDLPLSVLHDICYVQDVGRLETINCPNTADTVAQLSALCIYQDAASARADSGVCP